ncbi:MAG TPA: carbohydrate ABC transporter permease, partial [Candidatus Polarisedimenticolia bacterium]|nr:carbohydrate ABC transporter permease [Candidatus Polarisedimenticolia bacterium]
MSEAYLSAQNRDRKYYLTRFGLHAALIMFALYFLLPLVVMISTSLKSTDEIRTGSLISLPRHITTDAWLYAWSQACMGTDCIGLGPHFWNSVKFVVPA